MLVAQLLFTLLESARNIELYKTLQMNTDSVLESMFADYASPLWESYRLLGTAAADSSGQFSLTNREAMLINLSRANLSSRKEVFDPAGSSLLTADLTDVEFREYLLMTDQEGAVFQTAVASYMKSNLAYELARSVYSSYEAVSGMRDEYGDGNGSIGDALNALEGVKENNGQNSRNASTSLKKAKQSATQKPAGGTAAETSDAAEENVLTTVVETQKTGILTLVLPDSDRVSGARMKLENTVSHRKLQEGTSTRKPDTDWYDQVLLNQYLIRYLCDYTDKVSDRGLNYELEYLIGGKSEDTANLKLVVTELLAIREAMNMASLMSSASKQAQALAMATLLAGATANPAIIEAVKYGILAAWAYAESVLDLRTLLQGGKIAVLKSEADWTSSLDAIPVLLSGWSQAKSSGTGISYKDYLGLLLFFHSRKTLAIRAMDVQEAAIRKQEGYENFRMDCLICETQVWTRYEYVPAFLDFVTLLQSKSERLQIERSAYYTYLL